MATDSHSSLTEYLWEPQPAAAQLVQTLLEQEFYTNQKIDHFRSRLLAETGTRLLDWVYSLTLPTSHVLLSQLRSVGFTFAQEAGESTKYWRHPHGIFPLIVTTEGTSDAILSIKVDSVDVAVAIGDWEDSKILNSSPAGRRKETLLYCAEDIQLRAIERHGCQIETQLQESADLASVAEKHYVAFLNRPRDFPTDEAGFAATEEIIDAAVSELGADWACDLFFFAERANWMRRNHAARVQYERQQKLGLGWANHDHHTFRSSRHCFHLLVASLEKLGFECRERFYAGNEASWGAQVLEQPECGFVVFADVDLSPTEITGDIAHTPLPHRGELGTIGLWCALHGESFLQAGMHHLECQFDFDASREQLANAGVETMTPFTDFPFLRQAFTQGEVWEIDEKRIETLLEGNYISEEQAEQFRQEGTIGSHLEILERNDGYKGFNQTGVSDIIARTDPRNW